MIRTNRHPGIGGFTRAIALACCLGSSGIAHAQDSAGIEESELAFKPSGTVIMPLPEQDGVVASVRGPGAFTVWTSDESEVPLDFDSRHFAIGGTISVDGVVDSAHLELLCTIDGNTYFSRTLARHGPMRAVTGSLDHRLFVLPFDTLRQGPAPTRLEMRVIMPGEGTITVRSASLNTLSPEEFAEYADAGWGHADAWWTDRQAGWIGGLVGSAIGIMGGVIGLLASRRAKRSIVMGMIISIGIVGAIGMVLGIVALLIGQPYAVWYPLLLIGAICLFIDPFVWYSTRKQYESQELERMAALDA